MPPEPAEQIGDSPGSRRLQAVLLDRVEAATLLGREVRLVEEPELTGALEPVVILGLKGLVFRPSHLIDGFPEIFGDMELVVHQFGVCVATACAYAGSMSAATAHTSAAARR